MAMRSYTVEEYRSAGISAGPFALESNPNQNYRTRRRKPILGFVMHITVGASDYTPPDTSAEGTTSYGATTTSQSSWHACTDSGGIIPAIRDEYVAWHAGVSSENWSNPAQPYINDATLGLEQGTGSTNWETKPDWWVDQAIRCAAVWCAPRVKKYGIPLVVVRDRNVMGTAIMAGKPFGFISHGVVAPHNRTDPGLVSGRDTYPWIMLFQYIKEELGEAEEMQPNDIVPGSNPPMTWTQAAVRGNWAYDACREGGAINNRLDVVEATNRDQTAAIAVVNKRIDDLPPSTGGPSLEGATLVVDVKDVTYPA